MEDHGIMKKVTHKDKEAYEQCILLLWRAKGFLLESPYNVQKKSIIFKIFYTLLIYISLINYSNI